MVVMTDVTVDLIVPLDPVLRALHRRQLSYRARVAWPVLLGNELGEPPPDIHLLGAFGEAPVLAIGNRIVPPADFTVDNEAIQWDTGSGPHRTTGMLRFGNRGVTAAGLVTTATSQLSVQMDLQPVFFDCLLSADAGAHVAVGGDGSIQLHTDGVSWDSATWVGAGLRYGYTVTADGGIGLPPVVVSQFVDTGTGVSWQPDGFGTNVSEDGVLTFDAQGELPDPDDRSKLAPAQAAFKIVLPTRMVAEFADDGAASWGRWSSTRTPRHPVVYALRGTYVDDISSHLVAPEVWDDAVAATGAATVTLSDTELANFRPFVQVQTPTGNRWSEVVRPQAVADFDAILKMNVPDDLAQFVGSVDPVTKRPILPKLDDEVLRIAQLPGVGGEAGPTWYSGLGVPYLVGSLSNVTDDPGAAMLNAKRSRMWMRTIMPSAPVYKVQMPALYAYRYGKNNPQGKNPAIQGYLDDQALTSPNHVAHVAEVTADAVAWKQQMTAGMPNVKPEDIKAFTDIVDELSALGEQGCYWAYRLFRFATSPAALSEVHGLSLSPAQDSSLLAVRVQSTCATLSVLDPSGTFTKEYVKVISLVQLTNVLPQLLNYAGYADGVRALVPQLVEAFIAEHLDSTDPDIQEAVKQLQDADRPTTRCSTSSTTSSASAPRSSGAYQWSRLLSKLGKYPGGIGVIAGSVITAAVAAGRPGDVRLRLPELEQPEHRGEGQPRRRRHPDRLRHGDVDHQVRRQAGGDLVARGRSVGADDRPHQPLPHGGRRGPGAHPGPDHAPHPRSRQPGRLRGRWRVGGDADLPGRA